MRPRSSIGGAKNSPAGQRLSTTLREARQGARDCPRVHLGFAEKRSPHFLGKLLASTGRKQQETGDWETSEKWPLCSYFLLATPCDSLPGAFHTREGAGSIPAAAEQPNYERLQRGHELFRKCR